MVTEKDLIITQRTDASFGHMITIINVDESECMVLFHNERIKVKVDSFQELKELTSTLQKMIDRFEELKNTHPLRG
jgi:hypothetical protein